MNAQRFVLAVGIAGLMLVSTGCGGSSAKNAEPSTTSTSTTRPANPPNPIVTRKEVLGQWSGDWGTMVLRSGDRGLIVGAYDHDLGTVTGRMVDGVFEGWWCEAGSREPTADAGIVEFRFAKHTDLSLDGRWQYGTGDRWREDWDLTKDSSPAPADLKARFDDPSAFCTQPTNEAPS